MATDPLDKAAAFVLDNWEALGVKEHEGVLHLPASIKRRTASGGLDEVPVMLRNVSNTHRFKARVQAREQALRIKLDLDRDRDLVTQLEDFALLTYAIRDPKTFDQHLFTLSELYERYDTQALVELWGRYNTWVEMLDPRFGEMSGEQMWQLIARIAKEKSPLPLVECGGTAQFTTIVFMAAQCMSSTTRPSWLQS